MSAMVAPLGAKPVDVGLLHDERPHDEVMVGVPPEPGEGSGLLRILRGPVSAAGEPEQHRSDAARGDLASGGSGAG